MRFNPGPEWRPTSAVDSGPGVTTRPACYCFYIRILTSNHVSQFLFFKLREIVSVATNKPSIYKRWSTVRAAPVLNKTNGHLSCTAQALYEIGVYFIEAYRVVRNHLLMAHNVIEHSFSLGGKHNMASPLTSCYVVIGCGESIRGADDTSILNTHTHTRARAHAHSTHHPLNLFNTTAANYPLCEQYYQG